MTTTTDPPKEIGPAWPKGSMALGCALPYYEGGQYHPGRFWTKDRAHRLDVWWGRPLLACAIKDILISDATKRTNAALGWILARDRAELISDSVGNVDPEACKRHMAAVLERRAATHAQRGEADRLATRWGEAAARLAHNLGMAQVTPADSTYVMARLSSLAHLDRDGLLPRCLTMPPDFQPPHGYSERAERAARLTSAPSASEDVFG
jgi:hypothetical protein